MKNCKTIFAILFIILLSISCSNDDNDSTPLTTEGKFFKAKIDGVQFSATVPEFGATKSGNTIIIACVQGIHKFQLKINNIIDNGVGSYSVPTTTTNDIVLTYENDVTVYKAGDCDDSIGFLTISSITANEITGAFGYRGGNTSDCSQPNINITEGAFKAILASN